MCAALAWAVAVQGAGACSIPVFRYGLDRWPADQYRLEVPAGVMATEPLAAVFRNLGNDAPVNLRVTPLAGQPAEAPARLLFPTSDAIAWTGRLDSASLSALTDSPARAEIARRILAGDSGVWVLVESDRREADEAFAQALEKRLRFLENVAELPHIDPNDPSSRLGLGPELRVKFSLLRVRADDPAETLLIRMLRGPKDKTFAPDAPWAGLVFGRGRVLGAWPAADLPDETVDESSLFLLGACSCQVKDLNPGWDLLLATNWEAGLEAAEKQRLSSTVSIASTASTLSTAPPAPNAPSPQPETVLINTAAHAPPAADFTRSLLLGSGAALLAAAGLFLWRRSVRK
ncbi:MAG: hypothetical protein M3463_14575 [Verrucomicrobiota bacterium]|nr:hypothetical protein [Verrucomicrobiota bacterium]